LLRPKDKNIQTMKRVAWLLLTAFCTAAVQMLPADGLELRAGDCRCCRPGACGMPGCCLPASAGTRTVNLSPSPGELRQISVLRTQPARYSEEFYSPFAQAETFHIGLQASDEPTDDPVVPLFKAHCCLLI
jgi:hypothetical protein